MDYFFEEPDRALSDARESNILEDWVRSTGSDQPSRAIFNIDALSAAIIDRNGAVVAATLCFVEDGLAAKIDVDDVAEAIALRETRISRLAADADCRLLAYCPAANLHGWNLPAHWRRTLAERSDCLLAVAPHAQSGLARGVGALRLSAAQARMVSATIRTGSIRAGAAAINLSYQRGRALTSEALVRSSSRNIAELVRKVMLTSLGIFPDVDGLDRLLMDMWGLTGRQVELALLVSEGNSRASAAALLSISDAVAKKELTQIYSVLGVTSAVELSRALSDHATIAILLGDAGAAHEFTDLSVEPLRFTERGDGRRIAYSDYGPQSGKPLFYIHSSMTSRSVPRALLAALREGGYRVLSIDRPGFGLTDRAEGDHYAVATEDFLSVQAELGIKGALALSRGAGQFLLALARRQPEALAGVIAVNPDPPSTRSASRAGPLGAAKEFFLRSPSMIGFATRLIAARLTRERIDGWLASSFTGSASDSRAIEDAALVDDYWLTVRSFTTGTVDGYAREQHGFATCVDEPLASGCWAWRFLLGEDDTLHDVCDAEDYWRLTVPGAKFSRVSGAGRLLAFSHVDRVVEELALLDRQITSAA